MYVCKVHPELSFVRWNLSATTALHSSSQCFSTAAIVLLCYALSGIFSNCPNNSDHSRLCQTIAFAQRMSVVKSLCFPPWTICATTVAATAAAVLKITALHETTLTASLGLIVCFFSLAIIQELSHDCSRANGEPREYLQRLSVKEIRKGLGCPMAGFYWDRQFCSTSPTYKNGSASAGYPIKDQ